MTSTGHMATSDAERLTALVLGDVEDLLRMMATRDAREAAGESCDDLDDALDEALGLDRLLARECWTPVLHSHMITRGRPPFLGVASIDAMAESAFTGHVSWPAGSAQTAEDGYRLPMPAQPCMSAITTNAPPVLSMPSGAPA